MNKDIKDMSVKEIFQKIGRILTPENVYYILKDDNAGNEYGKLCEQIKKDPKNGRERLYQYIIDNEESIDKEVLVLLTLQNYIEYRDNIDLSNPYQIYMYGNKIEICKKMLDNKDIAVYGYIDNTKTGIIEDIVEISSVELCAESSFSKIQLYPEQGILNRQRQDRYKQRKQNNKKTIERNRRRLSEIEKDFDFKNILQFINVSDYEDVIITEKQIAEIVKSMILRNGVIKGLNLDYKTITNLVKTDEFFEYTEKVDGITYIEEIENIIKNHIQFFDLDKMLLCAAYRAVEKVSKEDLEPQKVDDIATTLVVIAKKLEGKNKKLVGTIEDIASEESMISVEYDIDKLKKDISRFVDRGVFLTDKKISDIKNSLLSGEKTLRDISTNIIWQLELEDSQWDQIVKMSSENFIFFLDECEPTESDVKEVILEIEKISTECLYKLIKTGSVSHNEIVEICNVEKINLEQLIELATIDIIEDNTIIDSFNSLKEKNDEKLLSKEILLKYFNKEKIEEYIKTKKIDEKFLKFYNSILPEDEKVRNEILNELNVLIKQTEDKGIIMDFYNAKLISKDLLIEQITDNDILELYEKGSLDVNKANQLYKEEIIEQDTMALIIDEEYKNGDILKGLEDGIIDLPIALELYPDKKVYGILKKYAERIFKSPNPAIYAFATSNMEIGDINELYKKGIVKEKDLACLVMQGKVSKAKITELYINMLISEEIIDELSKKGIITTHDTYLMKKALGMKNIVKNMDKSLGIAFGSEGEVEFDEGIFLPDEKLGKIQRDYNPDYFPEENNTKQPKKVINPAIRERKFEMYGAKRIKRNNVEYNEKSPFNDYEFYIIPDKQGNLTPNSIVIAERYYEDKYSGEEKLIDGNATYLFELKDLTRISKKSKPEILSEMKTAKDDRMKRKLHTKNWAKNMDKTIQELLGIKLETCYTESELHDIRTLSKLIDGFKEKGESYRIFDVEF